MQRVNSTFEIEQDIEKLENIYEKFFIRWQETFTEKKAIDNKLDEIDTYIEND